MIIKLLSTLKKWALPLVVVYTIALSVGSLIKLNDIPSIGSSFDDKIYHFIAYFLFTILGYNYCKVNKLNNPVLISAVVIIIYGIIIEVIQGTYTANRQADMYDIYANLVGIILAMLFFSKVLQKKMS